ncbi:MAG: hypothetical protein ACPHID_00835 [Thermoplasmatota archaeon]
MELRPTDDRKVHLLTRGNVDGIVSAALFLARDPRTRVSFVPSGDMAVDVLRKDISSHTFYLVDLGLTPRLIKTVNDKAKTNQQVVYLDHHQQSAEMWQELDCRTDGVIQQGISAAGVASGYLGLRDMQHLVAVADEIEYTRSGVHADMVDRFGLPRIEQEARILDFAWRFRVEDDKFRLSAARRLAAGKWPSEVPEIKGRYHQMCIENRWERALDRVRERVEVKHNVALLKFGRRKPSLFGFGSRALTHVALESGAGVAVMLNRRPQVSSLSLRRTDAGEGGFNLGRFVADFTASHGIVGGGHPHSAGARIPSRSVPEFLKEVYCLA